MLGLHGRISVSFSLVAGKYLVREENTAWLNRSLCRILGFQFFLNTKAPRFAGEKCEKIE